jgi:hypothetical protein
MRYHERLKRLEEKDCAAREARVAAVYPHLITRLKTLLNAAGCVTLRGVLVRVLEPEARPLTTEEWAVIHTVMADAEAWALLGDLARVVQREPEDFLLRRGEAGTP